MQKIEMLEIIEECLQDTNDPEWTDPNRAEELLWRIEMAGMLPPKSNDIVSVKKGLVRGYSMMFEWDDE